MVIGWDIGGVNTKAARVDGGALLDVRGRPYELQRAPDQLCEVLRGLASALGVRPDTPFRAAVTMTAELSQMFRTKRDGVRFVLDAVATAFPSASVHVFALDGRFVTPGEARRDPLAVAAANWTATAAIVARHHPDAVLVDIGTTSTDIVPIRGGRVTPEGRTDPERLASGELVYTGALRTPAEAMAAVVPTVFGPAGVSAEGFAIAGDVHLWRGDLDPADYTVTPPDGRPAERVFAGERLARVVCADREILDEPGISAIADALADAQAARVEAAIRRVAARHPTIRTAVVAGLGAFIGARAARAAGLEVVPLAGTLGEAAGRYAPAACVALLLDERSAGVELRATDRPPGEGDAGAIAKRAHTPAGQPAADVHAERPASATPHAPGPAPRNAHVGGGFAGVRTVVKIGGGLLAHDGWLDRVLASAAGTWRERPPLVVAGGGPFADAVRDADRRLSLSDDAAHWMAVLAMDQYAHLIASRCEGAIVVDDPEAAARAAEAGRIPVLAPYRWLRAADPLPHSWDVTSDSIAAWVAGQVGARELVLIKPPRTSGPSLVDAHFAVATPPDVKVTIVAADQMKAAPSVHAQVPTCLPANPD